jgi:hypothetical protein
VKPKEVKTGQQIRQKEGCGSKEAVFPMMMMMMMIKIQGIIQKFVYMGN